MSSELLPQYGLAIMRSNRWPGAVAFAKDRWATKHTYNYIVTSFPFQLFKFTVLFFCLFSCLLSVRKEYGVCSVNKTNKGGHDRKLAGVWGVYSRQIWKTFTTLHNNLEKQTTWKGIRTRIEGYRIRKFVHPVQSLHPPNPRSRNV